MDSCRLEDDIFITVYIEQLCCEMYAVKSGVGRVDIFFAEIFFAEIFVEIGKGFYICRRKKLINTKCHQKTTT